MLTAHYRDVDTLDHSRLLDVFLWVATILMGSSALKEPLLHFSPAAVPALTFVWLFLYSVATISLIQRCSFDWLLWLLRYRMLLAMALFGALGSSLWAIDANLSLQRSVHLVGCGLLAVNAGFFLNSKTLLNSLFWTAATLLLVSLAVVFVVPELGVHVYESELVWRGAFANKNTLGFWCSLTALLGYCLFIAEHTGGKRFAILLVMLLATVCLFESKSATSLLALLAGLSVAIVISIAHRLNLGLAQQTLLSVLACALVVLLIQAIDTHWLNSVLGRSGNLTGRAEVWQQTWDLILEKPLGGYGYGNLWNPTEQSVWIQKNHTNFTWIVYHAHNGLLQIGSELGLIVATIVLVFVIQQLLESFQLHYQLRTETTLFFVIYSVAFLLSNYSEARLMIDRDFFWIIFLAGPIGVLYRTTPRT